MLNFLLKLGFIIIFLPGVRGEGLGDREDQKNTVLNPFTPLLQELGVHQLCVLTL